MLTDSPSASTSVMKKASTSACASVAENTLVSSAHSAPLAIVASSHGKRKRKAASGEAPRTWKRRKPSISNSSFACSRSATSKTSSVSRVASTTPTRRRPSSTTGSARKRCSTSSSHASSTVAAAGIATTRSIITSPSLASSGAVSSRRVGSTPTSRSSPSTT